MTTRAAAEGAGPGDPDDWDEDPDPAPMTTERAGLREIERRRDSAEANYRSDSNPEDHDYWLGRKEAFDEALALAAAEPVAGGRAAHEHYWVDAPDDETGWHCTICGLTEYPGDPGIGSPDRPSGLLRDRIKNRDPEEPVLWWVDAQGREWVSRDAALAADEPETTERAGLREETIFVAHPAVMALSRKDRMAVVAAFQQALAATEPGLTEYGACGSLAWTVEAYGRVTHKHSCPNRTDPWCQTHPKGCPENPSGLLREAALTAYRVWIEGQDRADGDGFFTGEDWESLVHAMDALDDAALAATPDEPVACDFCATLGRPCSIHATPDEPGLDVERLARADEQHQAEDNCTHQDYRRECAPMIAARLREDVPGDGHEPTDAEKLAYLTYDAQHPESRRR